MTSLNDYGSYLIRDNASKPGIYSLSIRDRDDVKHYRIRRSDDERFYIAPRAIFRTLQDLVAHYQQQADGLCVNLVKPCNKSQLNILPKPVYDEWEIERSSISLHRKIRESEFCEEWGGLWNYTTTVVVRTHKPRTMSADNFMKTAALMKKLCHEKIIQLYAVCTKGEPIYIVTEFMNHGTLYEYLQSDKGRSLKLPHLIDMASQVAAGLAYLQEQNIIHRDIAAINILVGEPGLTCKVANFEMARKIDEDGYVPQKGEKLAIKWTALEVILQDRFNIKSDVWSFGILLYEVITFGHPPYPGMSSAEAVLQLQKGYRMPPPPGCLDKVYNIMLDCWREEPTSRPTFETLRRQLEEFLNNY